ncbi:hypothetical protein AQUCO_01800200v1 [Aquilegia coerulea]|uniref:Uncharacterized protein n=1 Tax=Aquilegia coerulea TaxID=218851 RepID=A0A2G5DKG3_AQUCA|nr:hypothetical protein AQUCO_01800200v1 [Aquilegia coerulea]
MSLRLLLSSMCNLLIDTPNLCPTQGSVMLKSEDGSQYMNKKCPACTLGLKSCTPRPTKTRSESSAKIALTVSNTTLDPAITPKTTPVVPRTLPNTGHSISLISSTTPLHRSSSFFFVLLSLSSNSDFMDFFSSVDTASASASASVSCSMLFSSLLCSIALMITLPR